MGEREELLRAADSFDDVLVDSDGLCLWTDVANALAIMRRKLADYTCANAQGAPEAADDKISEWVSGRLRNAASAALRAPEAADAGAVAPAGWFIGDAEDGFHQVADEFAGKEGTTPLYASPTDAGMRERAALEGLVSACNRYDEEPDSGLAAAGYYSAMEAAREALALPSTMLCTDSNAHGDGK